MPIPGQSQKKRGVGHWFGQKRVVLSPEAAKLQRERFAAYQEAVAAERARVDALKSHPDLQCSACGNKFAGKSKCPRGCLRSHGVVFVPHAEINAAHFAKLAAEKKAVEDAEKATETPLAGAEKADQAPIAPEFPSPPKMPQRVSQKP